MRTFAAMLGVVGALLAAAPVQAQGAGPQDGWRQRYGEPPAAQPARPERAERQRAERPQVDAGRGGPVQWRGEPGYREDGREFGREEWRERREARERWQERRWRERMWWERQRDLRQWQERETFAPAYRPYAAPVPYGARRAPVGTPPFANDDES